MTKVECDYCGRVWQSVANSKMYPCSCNGGTYRGSGSSYRYSGGNDFAGWVLAGIVGIIALIVVPWTAWLMVAGFFVAIFGGIYLLIQFGKLMNNARDNAHRRNMEKKGMTPEEYYNQPIFRTFNKKNNLEWMRKSLENSSDYN